MFFGKDFMILYFHFLQKDLKTVYLFQQQSFSSPTMLIKYSLKKSPRMYCQGQMQPHAFSPPLWACQQSFWSVCSAEILETKTRQIISTCLKSYELPMYENK